MKDIEKQLNKYINSLRNKAKIDYARAFAESLLGTGPHPDFKEFGLSYMAAQAVRMNLWDIAKPQI